MVVHPRKCHFMYTGKDIDETEALTSNKSRLKSSEEVAVLDIKIHKDVSSKGHIKASCRKSDSHMIIPHTKILRRKSYFTDR